MCFYNFSLRIIALGAAFYNINLVAQTGAVNVTDQTLKIASGQTESLYYGFAAGDEIVMTFNEVGSKPLKEVEIIELPENKKFSAYKVSTISEKRIKVYEKGVYEFKFVNDALAGRICQIKIDRIPATADLVSFNTDWVWKTLYDTTYNTLTKDSLTGYDSLYYKETTKDLIKTETIEDLIIDKVERVNSYWNSNGNYRSMTVNFPVLRNEEFFTQKIIAWSYWVGVGEEGASAFEQNVEKYGGIVSDVVSYFNPLAGLAIGVISTLIVPTTGEDVQYAFFNEYGKLQQFMNGETYYSFDTGRGVAAYGKNNKILKGPVYIGLYNNNDVTPIDVNVKIMVIIEQKTYEMVEHDRIKVTPRYVTLKRLVPNVTTSKIRINAG